MRRKKITIEVWDAASNSYVHHVDIFVRDPEIAIATDNYIGLLKQQGHTKWKISYDGKTFESGDTVNTDYSDAS